MIADWTVEVGAGCPVIELPWPGWVDLRAGLFPVGVAALCEVQAYPELVALLRSANHGDFATAKLDVFAVDRSEADPEITEEPQEQTAYGLGSYLDIAWLDIARHEVVGIDGVGSELPFASFEGVARAVSDSLRTVPLALSTAEIVVRAARLYHRDTFGWTLYAVGFGLDAATARQCWGAAAEAVVAAFRAVVEAPPWASSSIG